MCIQHVQTFCLEKIYQKVEVNSKHNKDLGHVRTYPFCLKTIFFPFLKKFCACGEFKYEKILFCSRYWSGTSVSCKRVPVHYCHAREDEQRKGNYYSFCRVRT